LAAILKALRAWLELSRLPFHTVGVLPFALGGLLAARHSAGPGLDGAFRWDVMAWGTLCVVLVMLAAYYAGEYWDDVEDRLSAQLGRSRFAGGSGVMPRGLLPRRAPLVASIVCLLLALGVGTMGKIVYGTGPWTIPLGILGLLGGFFYSTRPIRWVSLGLGEAWIAFCYGWLPVAASYYLQVGELSPLVHWMAVPIGLTIANVILLNEFPDYRADVAAGKGNLVVRLGRPRAAYLYALLNVGSWIGMLLSVLNGVPRRTLWFYLPIAVLSLALSILAVRGRWQDRDVLERLCAATLAVNLGTTAAYILGWLLA
jgi:1,4-dihydroxy-2-naphthoate octaprenyltransferase